jgi:hypothetical protein
MTTRRVPQLNDLADIELRLDHRLKSVGAAIRVDEAGLSSERTRR